MKRRAGMPVGTILIPSPFASEFGKRRRGLRLR
jgi:hypothetical protein